VVMLTVQALCRDAVDLAASSGQQDGTSGALTQWKQRLLAVSPNERIETSVPCYEAGQRNDDDEAPETRLESMVREYEYHREIIAQCDLVRRRLKEFRVEPEASPVDLWVTDAYAPRPQAEIKIEAPQSEEERQAAITKAWSALSSANGDCSLYERLLHSKQMAIVHGEVQLLGFLCNDAVHVIRYLRFEPEKLSQGHVPTLVIFSGGGPLDGTLPGLMRDSTARAELSGTWLPMVRMMQGQLPWQAVVVPRLPDAVSPSDVLARLFATKREQQRALIVVSELPWKEGVALYDSTCGGCSCFVQIDAMTAADGSSSSVAAADREKFVCFSFSANQSDGSLGKAGFYEIFKRIAETASASIATEDISDLGHSAAGEAGLARQRTEMRDATEHQNTRHAPPEEMKHRCPQGHLLLRGLTTRRWYCDICHKNFSTPSSFGCRRCDFDVCASCHQSTYRGVAAGGRSSAPRRF
jgi:hypothetical protein